MDYPAVARMAHPPSTCFGVSSGGTIEILLRNCEISSGIEQAARDLLAQRHRHDVLENCLRELEEDESIDAVGYGGAPNILGVMELDASFMDGNNRSVGAVAAVQKFLPIK